MGRDTATRRNLLTEQLGMAISTARSKLVKMLLFRELQRSGNDNCFKCGDKIEDIDHLSIEHKIPWLHDDSSLFWDLDNVAFSHLKCNRPRSRRIYANLTDKGRAYTQRRRSNPVRYARFLTLKRKRWAEGYRWPKLSGSSPTAEANGLSPL